MIDAIQAVRTAAAELGAGLPGATASGALASIGESLANVERQAELLTWERARQARVAKEREARERAAQAERDRKLAEVRGLLAKKTKGKSK
jgi:hypothetical protein